MEKDKVIEFINYNISLEHSAIVQYLFHAYTIHDEGLENKLEEIAREEMKHLRMFAHKVVELGGIPAIDKRTEVFLEAPTIKDILQLDIEAETMAIEEYSKQLSNIQDKSIKKLFERVIEDEKSHLHIFKDLQKKVVEISKGLGENNILDENMAKIVSILNKYLQKQYQTILDTLYQSFMTRHKDMGLSDELEQRAIDKMKHFGWIAEEIAEKGQKPDFSLPNTLNRVENKESIIAYQIKDQKDSSEEIKAIENTIENKDLKWILDRISRREIHYKDLEAFLENPNTKEEDITKIVQALTVGSLFKKK
jgi:bacterioferritin